MSYELLDLTQYQGKYPDSIRVEGEIWPHFVALLREDKILRRALEMVCADVSTSGMLSFFDDNQEVVSDPKAIADNYITEALRKIGGSK